MGCVIGVDVGSQSVKALVVDERGNALADASAPCQMIHPASGWAEQQPTDWEHALALAVREARSQAGITATEVTMLGLACQVDGLVAMDHQLRALRPGIIWLDRRATVQTDALADAVGEDELVRRTGLNPDASHSGPKAMWLRDVEPEHYDAARWLAPVGGHLNGWLTGEVVQDHANASSTLLYDVHRRAWSDDLVAHAGLDAERLPPIRSAGEVIGPLRAQAAEALGLSGQCRVVVGTGDEHGAALGAGALGPGVIVDVTGTAEPVAVPSQDVVLDSERLVETHAHAVDGMLLIENPGFVSGGSTQWFAATLGVSQAQLFDLARQAPAGSDGALFLPTLSGATAPRWNDAMRGCFAGLALNHGPSHLARAVLEGCAFALRDIIDRFSAMGLGGDVIRVVGGGARSALWLQIKADVTNRPVLPVQGDHATSAGAAMLAGVAAGYFADLEDAASHIVRLAPQSIAPDAGTVGLYDDAHGAYRRLFDGVEGALS
ncbi:MAG: FGGY-family carbohydrate kinase [Solirubrobacteraceae bacterium]